MKNDAELQAELRALSKADGHATVYNNEKGLEAKRDAIDLALDFPQTLAVVSRIPVAQAVPNHDDDLNREKAFYTQAQAAVAIAGQKLETMKVPYLRPDDYYAEMLKSDGPHAAHSRYAAVRGAENGRVPAPEKGTGAQKVWKAAQCGKKSKIKPLKSAWPSTLFPRYESAGRTMVVVYLTWTLPLSRRPRKPIKAAAGGAVRGGNRGGRGGSRGGRGGRRGGRGGKRLGKGRRQKMRRG